MLLRKKIFVNALVIAKNSFEGKNRILAKILFLECQIGLDPSVDFEEYIDESLVESGLYNRAIGNLYLKHKNYEKAEKFLRQLYPLTITTLFQNQH